jgi:hypothetical protein
MSKSLLCAGLSVVLLTVVICATAHGQVSGVPPIFKADGGHSQPVISAPDGFTAIDNIDRTLDESFGFGHSCQISNGSLTGYCTVNTCPASYTYDPSACPPGKRAITPTRDKCCLGLICVYVLIDKSTHC